MLCKKMFTLILHFKFYTNITLVFKYIKRILFFLDLSRESWEKITLCKNLKTLIIQCKIIEGIWLFLDLDLDEKQPQTPSNVAQYLVRIWGCSKIKSLILKTEQTGTWNTSGYLYLYILQNIETRILEICPKSQYKDRAEQVIF